MTPNANVTSGPQVAVKTLALLSNEMKISEEPQSKAGNDINTTSEHTQYVLFIITAGVCFHI